MIPCSVLARAIRAFVGLDLAGQQLEQGGLAGAVGADHADPVAALDAQGEVPDDGPLAEALGHLVGVDHHLGLDVVILEPELRGAGRAEHRGAGGAHLVELGEPALVAPAPGGDAALQPVELELEPGVELLGVARLLRIDLLGPGVEAAEADLGAAQSCRGRATATSGSGASGRCGRG